MTTARLPAAIEAEEGRKLVAYPDPESPLAKTGKGSGSPWTIGVGHTGLDVQPGTVWTDEKATTTLAADIARAEAGLDRAIPWWRKLDDVRQDALVQMAFQMGAHEVSTFTTFLALLRNGAWVQAANDLTTATKWAKQTPARAGRIAHLIKTGAYPA